MVLQNGLTVITPVIPEKLDSLRELLNSIGKDIKNNQVIPFQNLTTVHYCRWFLIDQAKSPEGELYPPWLAFITNYDGELDAHISEVCSAAMMGIDKIYEHCIGYPVHNRSHATRCSYLKKYIEKNRLFWPAYRGGNLARIKNESILRDSLEEYIDKNKNWKSEPVTKIREKLREFVGSTDMLKWALTPAPKRNAWDNFIYISKGIVSLILLLVVVILLLPIWIISVRFIELLDARRDRKLQPSKQLDDLIEKEDHQFQNQLTIYGTIKKPYWFRLTTLKVGLWLFKLNGTYRANKGKLSGIETIHFARWVIFNKGRNFIFLSDYDGSWENYLTEFINRSAGPMNLTFGNSVGYPKTKFIFWDGAHDEQAFKAVVRDNQYPAQVWYSAYPELTIRNILNNGKIRAGLSGSPNEQEIKDWLRKF